MLTQGEAFWRAAGRVARVTCGTCLCAAWLGACSLSVAQQPDAAPADAASEPETRPGETPAGDAPAAEDPAAVRGAEAEGETALPARLVRVNLPLRGNADVLKQTLLAARDRLLDEARRLRDPRRPLLVLQIAPAPGTGGDAGGSEFETAFAVADLVSSRALNDVKTVAWAPQSIRGHGALVAIACEELVMGPDAEIGDAGADEPAGRAMRRAVVEAYREIADARRTIAAPLAIGMIDPDAEVLKVETEAGVDFVLADELDALRQQRDVIDVVTLVPAGTLGRFTGREGREYGFVKFLAADKDALARTLGVDASALTPDDALSTAWNPVMIDLQGEITRQRVDELRTLIDAETARGVNWIGLRIDSVGGDVAAALELANYVAGLDPNAVRTVAYVPVEARGGAALAALACDQLAMHPTAESGVGPDPSGAPAAMPPRGAAPRPGGGPPLPPWLPQADLQRQREAAVQSIRASLAQRTERSWSLLAAMIDPGIELFVYRNKLTGAEQVLSGAEAESLPDADDWVRGAPLEAQNERLAIDGGRAEKLGVAAHAVDSFDQLRALYGNIEPRTSELNWALKLVRALASPGFAGMLILIGLAGVYIELKTPGVGLGGFVAAVAFLLFFWSKYLDQTATWLEILLFVSGLVFLMIEVFVLPGFGIFGLGGGLLVIFSLVLASQTFVLPRTPSDLAELRRSVTVVAAAGAGLMALAVAGRRLLPHAPLLNRMILVPPAPEEKALLDVREKLADYEFLVGSRGVAQTHLRPAGKALIDGQLCDVTAEADWVERGSTVTVVSARANRIVVRSAEK